MFCVSCAICSSFLLVFTSSFFLLLLLLVVMFWVWRHLNSSASMHVYSTVVFSCCWKHLAIIWFKAAWAIWMSCVPWSWCSWLNVPCTYCLCFVPGGDVVISKHVTKQVKLAQECIERVAVLVDKIGKQNCCCSISNLCKSKIFKLAY